MISVKRSMECPIIKKNTLIFRYLVRKSEERRLFGRSGHRVEDNIKMDHIEIGCEVVDYFKIGSQGSPLCTLFHTRL
jgi:hypothetical protein